MNNYFTRGPNFYVTCEFSHRVLFYQYFHRSAAMDRKKLLSTIRTLALQLNNKLPDNVGYYWVTYEELHQRLIHAGVSKLLSLDHVKDALVRSNKGQRFLAVWNFNNTNYYRSKLIDVKDGIKVDVPLDQRYKAKITPVKSNRFKSTNAKTTTAGTTRIDINPARDYFKHNGVVECELINESLERLHELSGKEDDSKISEFVMEDSFRVDFSTHRSYFSYQISQ